VKCDDKPEEAVSIAIALFLKMFEWMKYMLKK
jgi:hypothetical protein